MLVYDVTHEKSFENIRNWIRNIEEVRRMQNVAEGQPRGVGLECQHPQPPFSHHSTSNVHIHTSFLLQNASADVEKMILGNKCDLEESRVVTRERGQMLAAEHSIKFFETSAKSGLNVEEAFLTLARDIKEKMDKPVRGRGGEGKGRGDDLHAFSLSACPLRLVCACRMLQRKVTTM